MFGPEQTAVFQNHMPFVWKVLLRCKSQERYFIQTLQKLTLCLWGTLILHPNENFKGDFRYFKPILQ